MAGMPHESSPAWRARHLSICQLCLVIHEAVHAADDTGAGAGRVHQYALHFTVASIGRINLREVKQSACHTETLIDKKGGQPGCSCRGFTIVNPRVAKYTSSCLEQGQGFVESAGNPLPKFLLRAPFPSPAPETARSLTWTPETTATRQSEAPCSTIALDNHSKYERWYNELCDYWRNGQNIYSAKSRAQHEEKSTWEGLCAVTFYADALTPGDVREGRPWQVN